MNHDNSNVTTAALTSRPIGTWKWLGIGAASAVVGLLPWIITGMRLPLQNLWGINTLPGAMPIGLLPFSQYAITLIAGIIVVGAATAGLVARSTRARQGRRGLLALTIGVLAAQAIAIVQSAAVVGAGLRPGRESMIYLAAVVAVAVASFVVGALVLVLIARMPRAGALLGMSIAAVAASWWVDAVIVPDPAFVTETQRTLLGLLPWVPGILCGVAIAWCGINTIGRVVAALVAVAGALVVSNFATAVTSATSSRVLARYPAEMLQFGVQVFQQEIGTAGLTLRPIANTIIVATAGLAVKAVLSRHRLTVTAA